LTMVGLKEWIDDETMMMVMVMMMGSEMEK
jgi:hypothetical protein